MKRVNVLVAKQDVQSGLKHLTLKVDSSVSSVVSSANGRSRLIDNNVCTQFEQVACASPHSIIGSVSDSSVAQTTHRLSTTSTGWSIFSGTITKTSGVVSVVVSGE